jgi:hypothetical protein
MVTPTSDNSDGECFQGICPGNGSYFPNTPSALFTLQITVGWRFFDMAGYQVGAFLPNGAGPYTARSIELRFLPAADGWQVDASDFRNAFPLGSISFQLADQFCSTGADVATAWFAQSTTKVGGYGIPFNPLLEGCLFMVNAGEGSIVQQADPLTDPQNGWYLELFGALLAVNDKAQALLPQLPRATVAEVQQVQAMVP